MTTKNDITGDKIQSRPNTDAYRENHDRIFNRGDVEAPGGTLEIEPEESPVGILLSHTPPPYLMEIHDGGEPIATITPDGTVTIHKEGGDKEAAQLFWSSLQVEGQSLHQKIAELQSKVCALRMKNDDLEAYQKVLSDELLRAGKIISWDLGEDEYRGG